MLEEHFGFALHVAAEGTIEFNLVWPVAKLAKDGTALGIGFGRADAVNQLSQAFVFACCDGLLVDSDAFDVADLQPLSHEVLDERIASSIFDHALDLLRQIGPQLASFGEI